MNNTGEKIYHPDEDTYTLLKVLEENIGDLESKVILEIGCGNGLSMDFLGKNLKSSILIGTDINYDAALHCRNFNKSNNIIMTSLFDGIRQEDIDVVIFNPPYWPTEHVDFNDIRASYSGGTDGCEIIYNFIEQVEVAVVFLLVINRNKPKVIVESLYKKGYTVKILAIKKVLCETIIIFKAARHSSCYLIS